MKGQVSEACALITQSVLSLCLMLALVAPGSQAATTASSTSATTEAPGTATATPVPTVVPITTSINPNAGKGKESQSGGSAANMAAGMMLMAAAMAMQPPNPMLLAMAAMAMAQSAEDKDAADQSATTQSVTNTSGPTTTNPTVAKPTYATAAEGTASVEDQNKIKAGMAAMKAAGYAVTPAGVSTPSGLVPASAFSSSGSMLAAGIDPATVKEVEKVNKDVASKYGTMSMAADTSGGSGGGGNGTGGSDGAEDGSSARAGLNALKNPFALGSAQRAELMAGKTVQFDGEPIGTRGNDIFQMVHAAYDRKRTGKHFIETDHDPELNATVRAPASFTKPSSVSVPPGPPRPTAFPRK